MGAWLEGVLKTTRERDLDRIAAAYAVGSWLIVQAASIALPAFDAPPWLLRWLIVITVIGFPLAMAGGWIAGRGAADEQGAKGWGAGDLLAIAAIALIAVLTFGELAWHSSAAQPKQMAEDIRAPLHSVAVLPFNNISGDPKEKYFSEGVSDEIIGLLARNPALRVAARTSSFYFEGKNQDVRTIAKKLNVRSILEGSVRTQGNRVRIEASLVNAADGYQIWSQSYDRALSDILAVQSDIAKSITNALVPALSGKPAKTYIPKPTQIDPEVYRAYLQAQVFFDQRLTEGQTPDSGAALTQSVTLFRTVAARAPQFADGQAALAHVLLVIQNGSELNGEIEAALHRALSIDPNNPQALLTAISLATTKWDWDGVIANAKILKRTSASTAVGAEGLAQAYHAMNLLNQAMIEYRQWAKLDPFSYPVWAHIAGTYFAQARYADVIGASKEALAIHPGDPVTSEYKCVALASLERVAEAKDVLATLSQPGIPPPLSAHCTFFILLHSKGEAAAAAFVHKRLAAKEGLQSLGGGGDVGFMLSHVPQSFDEAVSWYEKAFNPGSWGFDFYPGQSPPAAFFKNPRWIALTKRPEYLRWVAARERARNELTN